MALFRRMKSPKDRHVTHQTLETSSSSPSLIPAEPFHRRHKSEEDIILAVESSTAILDESPPELPPRNRSDSSGAGGSFSTVSGYRRTQSSGTMSTTGFKSHPPAAGTRPQEDYFVPADTLRNMSVSGSSPQPSPARLLAQDKRHMSMHDKILSHNAPDFRASQLNRSVEKLHVTDTGDYSVPFDVLGEGDARKGVPPPKPPHSKRGSRKPQEAPEKLSEPPDYLPPLPPSVNEEEEEIEQVSPQSSPSISKPRPGDYDDPWDSTKFIKLRQRSETEPQKLMANRIDPYKSPKGSNNELSETEPPLPPKLPDTTSTLTTTVASVPNDTHFLSPSPTPPPVPETSRPRASTGESDYVEPPDSVLPHNDEMSMPLHERVLNGEGYMHDYVNQPACPPKLPPRATNKKQHGYPQLLPSDISHPSDIQPLMPPAFPIDTSCSLEEQL